MSAPQLIEHAPIDNRTFSRPLPDNAPRHCPLCGRPLETFYWDTVDRDRRYWLRVCFGDNWLAPFHRRFKMLEPGGTHYQYQYGPTVLATEVERYDRLTGESLR